MQVCAHMKPIMDKASVQDAPIVAVLPLPASSLNHRKEQRHR